MLFRCEAGAGATITPEAMAQLQAAVLVAMWLLEGHVESL